MKEKKAHGVQLLIRCVVTDPDGKVISDTGNKKARSFLIQFLEYIGAMFDDPGTVDATATDGTEDMLYWPGQAGGVQFMADAGVNIGTHGLVVGTGDTAPTNTDYSLETKIAEGAGAGQLTHGVVVFTAAAVVGANVDMIIQRAFTNNSGSTITVKEAGIYTEMTVVGPYYHCIVRDVLGVPVDVPNRCSLAVYYTFRTTV